MSVAIETTAGDFTVDLFIEERPHACKNFLKLCKIKYYNFCLFHSIQHNFIAQTGDPTGSGKNGASVYSKIFGDERKFFEAEMIPKMKHSKAGLLSMVNCGDNMLGSQFFLTLSSELQSLDGEHCVFGEVAEGSEILLKLNEVICDNEHRPYQDIRITHTVILEDPFDDPPGLIIPDGSPEPSKETLLNGRIAADEDLDESKGLTPQELEEMVRQREAQAQATILEIVGDLPDADMAPPENVLFVCKLNPVTSDDDLEIIFSRFGKVKSCEVIRDKITGDSLQYAFVEFEEQKSCEDAFFKMDNVLIDDRRIHVDFSQSVSKMRWKGKGRGVEHFKEDMTSNNHKNTQRNEDRMPPPKDKNRTDGDRRANGRSDSTSKTRREPREQQSRQDPDRNKYRSDEFNSRRERHDDRPNLKDRSERHHRSSRDDRERSDNMNERTGRHHHDGHDGRDRGEKRPGREERNLDRESHRQDENRRREMDENRDKNRDDKVKENREGRMEQSRHYERSREERRERPQREDRSREERRAVERFHRDNRGRGDHLGGGKHSFGEEEREELRYPDSKGRVRDVGRHDKKQLGDEYENRHVNEKEVVKSKGRNCNKRPLEKETEKKSSKVRKTSEKAKESSKQKSVSKKRQSNSSSSSSSASSSSNSSGSSSSSDSSDADVKRRKTKSKKESARKKAKMAKKSRTKSKLAKINEK